MKKLNRFLQQRKKGTVFVSWVILFFVLVLVAFLIMGIYFYSMNSALENNLEQYNAAKTKQISTEVDVSATRLAMVAVNMANNENIKNKELLYSPDVRRDMMRDLSIQLEMNRNIYNICLYIPETNEVMTSNCIVKEKYFHSSYFNKELLTQEQWKEFVNSERTDYFCLLPFSDTLGVSEYKLTYVLNADGVVGKILVALNAENVMAGDPYFSKMLVAYDNGDTYSIYSERGEEFQFVADDLPKEGMSWNNGETYISSVRSAFPGLRYIMFTEKGVFNKDLSQLQFFSVIYLLIFLIVGLVLAWLFALRQYKPLSTILDTIKKVSVDKEKDKQNEYTEIESAISKLLQEQAVFLREARKRDEYIKERAIANLLNGRSLSNEMQRLLQLASGPMVIVRIVWNPEQAEQFENDFELMQFAVKNISEEMFSRIAEVHPTDMDGAVNLLLVFKENCENDRRELLLEVAESFSETMKSQLDMDTEVILGRAAENISQLPAVYGEVLEAQLLCSGYGEVIEADKLAERQPEAYSYSVQTEMEIIFCIKNGDYDGANEIISRELDEIMYQKNYPVYLIRCFMIELVSTILKAAEEIKRSGDGAILSRTGNIGKLFSATTIAEMELLLREYLKEVCDFVIDTNLRCSSSVCEEIKQYVRDNFADSEMNVNAIAAHFHLNSAYLSSMFKKNTGIKLLEYINKVRIDEAKKLMIHNPDASIEEIVYRIGFTNSRTFRRIFLKYENVPPSKFITKGR